MFNQLITERVHELIGPWIPVGGTVIDGTMGNGHDTLFLGKAVGNKGCVYAFDVQEEALKTTHTYLEEQYEGSIYRESHVEQVQWIPGIHLIHDSHERLKLLPIEQGIDAAVFNLGYLPGGNKEVTTRCSSTMEALASVTEGLKVGGVLSVVTYPGHNMGADEDAVISQWLETLSKKRYEVLMLAYMNRESAPKHYMVYRLR